MSFLTQPIAALPASIESKGFSGPALQQALSLKPSMAAEAAGQAMMGPLTPQVTNPLNPLKPELNPLNRVFAPLNGVQTHTDAELKHVSQKFEGIFLRMMFKEMRSTVEKSNLFGHSQAMEFFETMQDEAISDHLASAGGFGLGNVIYQRLKQATTPHLKTFS